MRDNKWLKEQLDYLLKKYFSDLEITNPVEISAGHLGTFQSCQWRSSDISIE